MKNGFVRFFVVVFVIIGLVSVFRWAGTMMGERSEDTTSMLVTKNNILQLDLEGVIMNGKKFLKKIKKYKDDDRIKAVVI
ncbi:MAG: signal peptide peptidase SppA, partial [Proteobacteria bacterium]